VASPKDILEVLDKKKIELAGEVIFNPSILNGIFLPLILSRDSSGKPRPSHKDLFSLKNELSSIGFSADFLLIDKEAKTIEDGLRASFISSFPDAVRNVFVTVEEGIAHIWIDNKRHFTSDESEHIAEFAEIYANNFNIRTNKIYIISDESLPTNTELLNILRKRSPANCDALRDALIAFKFAVPSTDWINRKLDVLRKAGMIVRRADRTYVLTYAALHSLGTSKNRYSPDVGRLLALARRGR
jgi:hypothetical protein